MQSNYNGERMNTMLITHLMSLMNYINVNNERLFAERFIKFPEYIVFENVSTCNNIRHVNITKSLISFNMRENAVPYLNYMTYTEDEIAEMDEAIMSMRECLTDEEILHKSSLDNDMFGSFMFTQILIFIMNDVINTK